MIDITATHLLKSIPCFNSFNSEVLERLLGSAREQSFAKEETILLEGDPCPGLFVVKSGLVKLYRTSLRGDEQIMRVVSPGGCFECAPLFDGGPNPVSAQALEASKMIVIPIASFESLVSSYPEVALQFVPILAMRLRDLLNTVEDFSFRPVPSRVAKLLLQLGERPDDGSVASTSSPLTQQHLACVVGCSRQVLNSTLQELVKEGIIKIEKRRIIVLKPEALLELTYPEL
ncbi:MAG: Crp/Fnr family transcriptional regulator [Chloroflexi bacterium]|nr:Crp/Fnr family transcriptional regulator [Chloroflexota bacterium]